MKGGGWEQGGTEGDAECAFPALRRSSSLQPWRKQWLEAVLGGGSGS